MSLLKRTLLIGTITLLVVFVGSSLVSAHANLVRSDPPANAILDAAPANLRLWFSETPELSFSQVQLFDSAGKTISGLGTLQVDPRDRKELRAVLPTLEQGIYTVAWRVLSAEDGHVTSGMFAFVIGRDLVSPEELQPPVPGVTTSGQSGPTVPSVALRWLTYLTAAMLTGGFAFVPIVLQPALAKRQNASSGNPRGSFSRESGLFSVLSLTCIAAFIACVLSAIFQAATSANVDPLAALGGPLAALLIGTRYGVLFWLRVALLVGVTALLSFRQSRWWHSALANRWWWTGVGINLLILLTISLNSHAAANQYTFQAVLTDWLHMTAVSIWTGGLVTLLLALAWLRRDPNNGPIIGAVISRFSQVATTCLIALGLTGLYRALVEVQDFSNLFDTPYGRILVVKLGLFGMVAALGGTNFVLSRRAEKQHWQIGRTVRTEAFLVALILLVTGVLTSLPPAREAFGAGLTSREQIGDLRVIAVVSPGVSGLNTFNINLRDEFGNPLPDAQKVALIFTMVEHDMGTSEAVAENRGNGLYVAQGAYMSMPGTWQLEVLVRRTGQDDVRGKLILPVRATSQGAGSPTIPLLLYPTRFAFGLMVLVCGLIILFWVRRLTKIQVWAGSAAILVGIAAASLSAGIMASAFVNTSSSNITNPVPPDARSLDNGKLMYGANCAVCHGAIGAGDGPAAAALNSKPADLRVHMAAGHTDADLYEWISQGIENTTMPAFEGRLSEQQRWDVINYIRTFAR